MKTGKNFLKRTLSILLAAVFVLTLMPETSYTAQAAKKVSKKDTSVIVMYPKDTYALKGKKGSKYSSNKKGVAEVSPKGVITAKKKGKAQITVSYKGKKTKKTIDVRKVPSVTREDWITALVSADTELDVAETESTVYADTRSTSFEKYVNTAYGYGALPKTKDKNFHPYKPATREFVAYTLVHALGFELSNKSGLSSADNNKLKYAAEDGYIVDHRIIKLKKKSFRPDDPLTSPEKEKALLFVKKCLARTKIDPDHKNEIEFSRNINETLVQTKISSSVKKTGKTMKAVINSDDKKFRNLKKGQILLVPTKNKDEAKAVKVSSVILSKGRTIVSGTVPEMDEMYDDIDVQYSGELRNGRTDRINTHLTQQEYRTMVKAGLGDYCTKNEDGSYRIDKKLVHILNAENRDNNGSLGKEPLELGVNVSVAKPDIQLIVKKSLLSGWERLYFAVTNKVGFGVEYSKDNDESDSEDENKKWSVKLADEFFSIPGTPLSVKLEEKIGLSVEGELGVYFDMSSTQGIDYTKNDIPRIVKDFKFVPGSQYEDNKFIDGDFSYYPSAQLGVDLIIGNELTDDGIEYVGKHIKISIMNLKPDDIIGFTASIGPKVELEAIIRNNRKKFDRDRSKFCLDFSSSIHLEVDINRESVVGAIINVIPKVPDPLYEHDLNIGDEPFGEFCHLEYGKDGWKWVDNCTWEDADEPKPIVPGTYTEMDFPYQDWKNAGDWSQHVKETDSFRAKANGKAKAIFAVPSENVGHLSFDMYIVDNTTDRDIRSYYPGQGALQIDESIGKYAYTKKGDTEMVSVDTSEQMSYYSTDEFPVEKGHYYSIRVHNYTNQRPFKAEVTLEFVK